MISKKNILNFEARKKIYDFIEESPGLNVNEISRRLEIPFTTLLHHLRILEKEDLVSFKRKGEYKFAYAKTELGTQDKEILELLRKKVPCRIILHLFFTASCSRDELSKELDLHPSTVFYHLKKMMKMGIIEEAPVEDGIIYAYPIKPDEINRVMKKPIRGREIFYRRKNQKLFMAVGRVMIAHKDSLADTKYIDEYFSFLDAFINLGLNWRSIRKDVKRTIIKKDGRKVAFFKLPSEEEFFDTFSEMFRPPFCA
jgi:DNA-binding transcriptional ArsR family regulator